MPVTDFSRSAMANGNIKPYRAVMKDVAKDFRIIQGTVGSVAEGSVCCGIAQKGERRDPSNSDGFAAIAGENIMYWGNGAKDVPAILGGTVTRGDRLKAGTDGKLVVTVTAKDNVLAIANQSGILDDIIDVDVQIDTLSI